MAIAQAVSSIGERMVDEDTDLVERARSDPAAFATLYRRYAVDVYRYCYRCLRSREAAEDVTSQIFERAYRHIGAAADRPFKAWLFCIAHNAVIDHQRHRQPVFLRDDWDRQDAAPQPEEIALATESATELMALVARLPARERQLVELRLAGLTSDEIATVLGCSVGAFRTAHHRAIERLRALHRAQTSAEGDQSCPS